jgi:hypothetical protein
VVLYRCEAWSLTLREEHRSTCRLRAFRKRVLRKIFGLRKDEAKGGWRKLHNKELHNFYSSPSIIRTIKSKRMRWTGHVARMGGRRMHIEFWWESQKKETTKRENHGWVCDIKIYLR